MNLSDFEPVGHRILIKVEEREEKTQSGIIIATEETRERDQFAKNAGEVIALGPDCFEDYENPWCEVGDLVVYAQYAGYGQMPKKGEVFYRYINDTDVIAKKKGGIEK